MEAGQGRWEESSGLVGSSWRKDSLHSVMGVARVW